MSPNSPIHLPSGTGALQLALHLRLPASSSARAPVLILHGATFPAANAAAWDCGDGCWLDRLAAAGHPAHALDFLGFGASDRAAPAADVDPIDDLVNQVHAAVQVLRRRHAGRRLHLVAHSAGTFIAGRYAALYGESLESLVMFGAPVPPATPAGVVSDALDRDMSIDSQWLAFEPVVREQGCLDRAMFERWAATYLASDPSAAARTPPAVRVPAALLNAVSRLQAHGLLPYAPADIRCPTLVIQGEWDEVSPPAAGAWLYERLGAPARHRVVLPRGGHRLHLESARHALYREVEIFLAAHEGAPSC